MKRLFSPLIFLLLLTIATFSQAMTETVSVTASGHGDGPEQAVTNALVAAVRQAGGVTVAVEPGFRRQVQNWVIKQQGDVSTWIGSKTSVPEPQLPTMGNIKAYQVTGVEELNDAVWRATLKADVLRPKSPGADRSHLPGIAIAPFDARQDRYDLAETTVPAADVRRRLRDNLVTAFSQSGRYRVLDRANLAALEQEQAVVKEGSVAPQELARLGQRKGADLLLVGTIEDFQIGDSDRQFYGSDFSGYEPRVRVRYRLIDTTTSEILWADLFEWQKSEAAVRNVARQLNRDNPNQPQRLADALYPEIARAIAGAATDVLYPVQVIKVADKTVYLSQGQGRLEEGSEVQVFRPDGEVEDPDTGMTITLESAALATLKITDVRAEYGLATLAEKPAQPLKTGDYARRTTKEPSDQAAPAGQRATPGSSPEPIQWN